MACENINKMMNTNINHFIKKYHTSIMLIFHAKSNELVDQKEV
jgi:hypothetical protein